MRRSYQAADVLGHKLIETLLLDGDGVFVRLPLHLDRLCRSAALLGMPFQRGVGEAALAARREELAGGRSYRIRLTLDADGRVEVQHADLPPTAAFWTFAIAGQQVSSRDPWLRVKSTRRALYDAARSTLPAGTDELVFLNERAQVCEGTITNVFARLAGRLVTPPLSCGLLPGVLRRSLLERGAAKVAILTVADLEQAEAIYAGNSLRGLIPLRFARQTRAASSF